MIGDLALEIIFRGACFPVGWPVVKLATAGRYPSKGAWFAQRVESDWTSAVGLVVLLVVMMLLARQFS